MLLFWQNFQQKIIFTVSNNSIHKPPRPIRMRIEKVLPLPGDHGSKPERCRWLMNGVNQKNFSTRYQDKSNMKPKFRGLALTGMLEWNFFCVYWAWWWLLKGCRILPPRKKWNTGSKKWLRPPTARCAGWDWCSWLSDCLWFLSAEPSVVSHRYILKVEQRI